MTTLAASRSSVVERAAAIGDTQEYLTRGSTRWLSRSCSTWRGAPWEQSSIRCPTWSNLSGRKSSPSRNSTVRRRRPRHRLGNGPSRWARTHAHPAGHRETDGQRQSRSGRTNSR